MMAVGVSGLCGVAIPDLEKRLYEPMAGLPELKGAGNEG